MEVEVENLEDITKLRKIESYYNERARTQDSVNASGQWGTKERVPLICEEICNKVRLSNENIVLEIGCGSGVLGNEILNKCKYYAGIDLSFEMLKKFLYDSTKPNLVQASAGALPFRDNYFNLVMINSVTMYMTKDLILEMLSESERVVSSQSVIFMGENITPSRYYWEFTWFQNLTPAKQIFAKIYIKIRKYLASKNSKFGNKWADLYNELSPEFIKKYFAGKGEVDISDAAAYTVRQRILGNAKGNRRVDFLIRLY
ncbi:MAG: class I SAM-dependent methyltransferase [Patescibacteria group bacterium]|nr:class I SAM-dependent methyltransferase [Patescibacteria group bacterium]